MSTDTDTDTDVGSGSDSDTDTKGYAIFQETIEDWESYLNEYIMPAAQTIEDHNGEVLVGSTDPDVIEGEWDHNMTVVIEFPSVEAAQEWYNNPAYEEVKPIRHDACEYADAVICSGFSPEDVGDLGPGP